MQTRTILIPLFRGTSTPIYFDVVAEKFRSLLPYAVSVTLHSLTEGENATNDVEWNVVFRSGFDRNHESGDINKLESAGTQINANGSKRHTAFSDATKFMLESRVQVLAQNRAGVSGVRTVVVSAVVAVETVGM
jgi:hypothetical protein